MCFVVSRGDEIGSDSYESGGKEEPLCSTELTAARMHGLNTKEGILLLKLASSDRPSRILLQRLGLIIVTFIDHSYMDPFHARSPSISGKSSTRLVLLAFVSVLISLEIDSAPTILGISSNIAHVDGGKVVWINVAKLFG